MIMVDLNGPWTMEREDGRRWETRVPGTVLSTLLEHGEIPDPFDGMNEEICCRALDSVYAFERRFRLPEDILSQPHVDLVFEGIDTLAELSLNGTVFGTADNMHRTWRFDTRSLLRPGENLLRCVFRPAMAYVLQAARDNPDVTWEGGSELRWTGALRKAHYMFGWDWGPRLPDAGLWRGVRLEAYAARLEQVRFHQEHGEGRVLLRVEADTDAPALRVRLADPEGNPVAETEGPAGKPLSLEIPSPRLWWPNGLGDQPLYTVAVAAMEQGDGPADPDAMNHEDGTEVGCAASLDEQTFRLGLRTMTVSREPDEWGSSFALCCNGVPFFAMGADYIPEDNLLTRMNRQRTETLLAACRDANFNCVRVWGGGIYPGEDFFDLCDEMGLVVWQDLMFACNVYKLTPAFRESIVREAEDNLRRFRHHASLGLICGNNEMETGWLSWGGVKDQSEELKAMYTEQFEVLLKDVCAREAPDSFYWPSSPSSGGGFDDPNDLNRGDVHDWSVWHGRRPFSDFTERFPRFCSEFGFESFPCADTLRTFVHDPREMNPFSPVMEAHQKCHGGNGTILFYLSQTLRYPFSMEALIHASQYLQAEAVRAGVEHWRRNRGRCMGAIYWQLNDCWPVASWSSVDSLERWKALQYMARRFFAPVLVSLNRQEDGYVLFVSNERRQPFRGTLRCTLRDESGLPRQTIAIPVSVPALSSRQVAVLSPQDTESAGPDSADAAKKEALPVVQCLLMDESGAPVSENEALDRLPKHFPFRTPRLETRCDGTAVTVISDAFCLGVALDAGDVRFSDNWFTLYPGEPRVVQADRPFPPESLTVRCLSSD